MRETRLTLLADARFAGLAHLLGERLADVGRSIHADNFASLLDATMRRVIHQSFRDAHSSEGTVWLADSETETLTAAYNTGPNAEKLVGQLAHSRDTGIISMVFANERPFLENEVATNARRDKSLDTVPKLQTHAVIATPFYFLDACRGVLSCVKVTAAGAPNGPGFSEEDKAVICHAASTLGKLIDHRVLRTIVGRGF